MRENREKHQNYKIGVSPRDVINGYNEDETGDIPDQPFRTKQSADDDHTKFPTIKTSIPELASLILFTGRGDRVVIKLDKEHPEVIIAATSIGLDDDSLVLCMNAQGGYTPLALAKMNPNISFLMHEDNLLLRELAIRNIRTNYSINNALILSDEVYKEISTSESFSAVVYEPKSHHSMDLITSQFVRAHESLKIGGRLFVITHTKRGASQHMKLMQSVFGTEAFIESRGKGGFRVISISKNTSEAMYKPSVRGEVEFNIGGE